MELIELLKENDIPFEIKGNRLIVYGNVDLSNTQLKELPKCPIIIFGGLNLSNTQIRELPDCIVKDYLDINGTPITKLSKNLVAQWIYTPIKGRLDIYIQKNGIIGINNYYKKSIAEWEEFFKERVTSIDIPYYPTLTLEEYDILEEDFKTAVKLYESWYS